MWSSINRPSPSTLTVNGGVCIRQEDFWGERRSGDLFPPEHAEKIANADLGRRKGGQMSEDLLFDSNGEVDVEGMIECRDTRKVPPNPPPLAAHKDWLDGKMIARLAVSDCID